MSIRNLAVGTVMVSVGLLLASQDAREHDQEHRPGPAPEQVKQRCEVMAQHMQAAHKQMEEMDAQLKAKLTAMREAGGETRIDAMAAVIEELVTQRRTMHTQHAQIMHAMMSHMGEHAAMGMEGNAREAMMSCPMMHAPAGQHGDGAHQDNGH